MNRPTKVKLGIKAREVILRGVNAIFDPVRMTLGPAGQNALLYRTYNRGSRITNDGVSVAKLIEPKDEFENLAAQTFREAAEKTNERVGDGTTSTIVIAGNIINKFIKELSESQIFDSNQNVMGIKKSLQNDLVAVLEKIKEKSHTIETLEELEKIASVSVEDERIGKIIAKVAWDVGVDGFIDVIEGYKGEIETEIIKGMRFPAKVAARAFISNPDKMESVIDETRVLVTNYKLENIRQLQFLNELGKKGIAKVAIFAPAFSDQVLIQLVKAVKNNNLYFFPIAVPSLRTEQLEDLAIYTGSIFVNKDTGFKIENVVDGHLGFASRIVAKDADAHEDATVIGGKGELSEEFKIGNDATQTIPVSSAVHTRIEDLKKQITETKIELHKKSLERRIASMSSAVGVIRVGGVSDAEILYTKLKIEDGVYAAKAALKEGYVKGGGLCLKEIAEELPKNSLTEALKSPYIQIQENAGGSAESPVIEIGEDIIDPAMVVRLEVEHAVSVASNLITAGIIIPEERDMTSGEGELQIANALNFYNKLWNKKESIYRDNEFEMMLDQSQRNEEIIANDNG